MDRKIPPEAALGAPEWQMDDAYGDIGSPRWRRSREKLSDLIRGLGAAGLGSRAELARALTIYEKATVLLDSLRSFAKCLGAKDSEDARVGEAAAALSRESASLDKASVPLFAALRMIPGDSDAWKTEPFLHWKFELRESGREWTGKLSPESRRFVADLREKAFDPLKGVFAELQKEISITARNSRGETVKVGPSKMIAVLKGDPDPVLRRTCAEGMRESYARRSPLYAALLNELSGVRLAAFSLGGADPLKVSLLRNRMSRRALDAMIRAIEERIESARDCVRLRAPFLGVGPVAPEDLMAPAPALPGEVPPGPVPYPEGIRTVEEALREVSPELSGFVRMAVERGWVDAKPSERKIGGAFYARFEEFRVPRVFSTYAGTTASVLQQGHELGHAFHYWVMRDLSPVETRFPMTLTETASTFNEAVIRRHLLGHAALGDRFGFLWQELRSWANFLLNTTCRMTFELSYLGERKRGTVSARRCVELMEEAWKHWYGDSAKPDSFLWAYKLHFYKTDQLIYNYPYTVGFLLSEALIERFSRTGADFYPFYVRLLRDTGRMTVDEIVERHFGSDAGSTTFWLDALRPLDHYLAEFRRSAAARKDAVQKLPKPNA